MTSFIVLLYLLRTRRRGTIRHSLFLERLLNNYVLRGFRQMNVSVTCAPPLPFEGSGALLEEGGTQAVLTTVLHAYLHVYITVSGLFTREWVAVLQLVELLSGTPGLQEDLLNCRLMPLHNLHSNVVEEVGELTP